jgi:putative aldouronate transport system substrate-binding protein
MKTKSLSLMLSAVVAMSVVAGCGQADNGGSNGGTTNGQASGGTDNTNENTKPAPAKISIMATLHTPEVPDPTIEKMIEEQTNTELEINWVPDGSYNEKLNASFATGTLPQAVFAGNQASFVLLRDAIRNGQFWEIGPLLKDYPNLQKLNPDVLKNTTVEGKLYSIYQERPLSRQGMIYRKDWADNLGLQAPTTIDELYNMLKAFKEKDPDKNGKNDTIGLTDRSDLVYGAFKTVSSYFGTPNGWGEKDGKLAPDFTFPEYMETMKWFKKLHQEGLINKDFPVTSKTDQQNLFVTGNAGVYIGAMGDVGSLNKKVLEVNPNAVLDVQNRIKGPKGFGVWSIPGYGSAVVFPKSSVKSEEELKGILAFFDKLMDPKLANLISYGVEGKHYTLKDGKVVASEDTKMTDREVKPYGAIQVGGPSTIDMLTPEYTPEVKAKAEELVKDNESMLINDPTAPLDSKTYNEKGARLQDIIKDATYKFILGNIDEAGFQKEIDRWMSDGGQAIVDEFNASYQQSK